MTHVAALCPFTRSFVCLALHLASRHCSSLTVACITRNHAAARRLNTRRQADTTLPCSDSLGVANWELFTHHTKNMEISECNCPTISSIDELRRCCRKAKRFDICSGEGRALQIYMSRKFQAFREHIDASVTLTDRLCSCKCLRLFGSGLRLHFTAETGQRNRRARLPSFVAPTPARKPDTDVS